MQMNMMHNTFLVFRNIQTHQVCVVYKRDDGNYGLIEPAESAGD
jgi:putative sigma-54 modulation protein